MTGPRELRRRAAQNRRRLPPQTPRAEEPPRQTAAQSNHANYTALMHSHDRMRTRHLPGQGGQNRA